MQFHEVKIGMHVSVKGKHGKVVGKAKGRQAFVVVYANSMVGVVTAGSMVRI